ncbi:hypothetical protein U1701_12950 [Sphingomonas sp. PB2P19]
MSDGSGYSAIRQRWTIAFGLQPRSRGTLVSPFVPPAGAIRPKTLRVAFG